MFVFLIYILVMLLIAGGVFQYTNWYRTQRLKKTRNVPPAGFQLTEEVNIDPTTGIRQRVWYNSSTGERWYENI